MNMETQELAAKLKKAGIPLFEERSGFPLNQAQRNLEGRSLYAEDSQLRTRSTKIHSVYVLEDGLILGLVESVQAGASEADGRVYRPTFFDVFGNIISQPEIKDASPTLKKAQADFWRTADELDAADVTANGMKTKEEQLEKALADFRKLMKELK